MLNNVAATLMNMFRPAKAAVSPGSTAASSPYSSANVRAILVHYMLGRLFSGLAGVMFVVLVVRQMNTLDYAQFVTMTGLAATLGLLSGLGLDKAITRYLPELRLRSAISALSGFVQRMVLLRIGTLALITVIIAAAWPYLSSRLFKEAAGFPIALAVLIISANSFQFLSLIMQAMVQQKNLTRILVVQWGGRLLLAGLLMSSQSHVGVRQALWIMCIPDLMGSLVLLAAIASHLRELGRHSVLTHAYPGAIQPSWSDIWKTSVNNYGYAWLITLPQANAMLLILAMFLGAPEVAAYGFFAALVERIRTYLPLNFILNIAEPVLIAGYVRSRDFGKLCLHSQLLYKLNLFLLMLLLAWTGAMAAVITGLLTGGKYRADAYLLPLLIAQVALGSHNTILQIVINSIGKSEILIKSGAAALCCMILAMLGSVASGHLQLLFFAPFLYEVVNSAVTILLMRRTGFPYASQAPFHTKLLIAALAGYGIASEVASHLDSAALQLGAAAATTTLVFLVSALALRVLQTQELREAKVMIRRADASGA
jgi:O-antigen/teichoic acid export membrane protein